VFERLGKCLRAYAEKDGRGYPDWAVRYMPIVRRLAGRDLGGERILEIGANENGFARFAGARTIAVDRALAHLGAARAAQNVLPVMADAAALPFGEGRIGLCVCVDTFEHLTPDARNAAAEEIARVLHSKGTGVVAFPTGAASSEAERLIADDYASLTGERLHWLDEHAAVGLPDAETVANELERHLAHTHRITTRANATLWVWKRMWRILMCAWPGRGNALFQALLRLLTPLLSRIHAGTCYRVVFWIEPREP